jgi:hypothetical protein
MSIHQLSVLYQADHDRLLLRVRTRDEQLFELWLTRRLMLRLWQPLQNTAAASALGVASKGSTILPEARDMMTQALRDQAKQSADFASPFDDQSSERPLGEHPMLVAAVDLKHDGQGQVGVSLRDAQGRNLSVNLTHDLLHNLLTLVEQALAQSEWGLVAPQSAPAAPAVEGANAPRVLN